MTVATRPAIHVRVPTDEQFGEDFMPSPELTALYDQLIQDYPETHGHLPMVEVKVVWKRRGGKSAGKEKLAKCVKTSGLARYFAEAEYVIWLAADHVIEREMTDSQIRSCLSHEMRHIAWVVDEETGEGKAEIVGHDVELFFSEVRELGAWNEFIGQAAEAFEQSGLF